MKTRLDAYKVEIVNIEEVRKEYPQYDVHLLVPIFDRFAWDTNNEVVMAVDDLEFAFKYINNGNDIENTDELEYQYNTRHKCSVCGEYLLIDDELYQDEVSGKPLCTNHSIMNENTGNYRAITDEEIAMRNHCGNCKFCVEVTFVPQDDIVQESWVCDYYIDDDMNRKSCLDVFKKCINNDAV